MTNDFSDRLPDSELTRSTGLFINVVRPANVSREKPLPVLFVSK